MDTRNIPPDEQSVPMDVTSSENVVIESSRDGNPTVQAKSEGDIIDNGHASLQQAVGQCNDQLKRALQILQDSRNFLLCPPSVRKDISTEITKVLQQAPPCVIIGLLGGTGVGKSSLLNALLNEDSILPTSGSRGCTAAVIELRFNRELLECKDQTAVYKGMIEFISLDDWKLELGLLIEECCDDATKKVSLRVRKENEEAASAWAKIDSVYGFGTMKSFESREKAHVLDVLANDERVVGLLQQRNGQRNNISIEEGIVSTTNVKILLDHMENPSKRWGKKDKELIRDRKAWAHSFRQKINTYVYRIGDGKEPQTWPLIRKVVLKGPWPVLSTGAVLVDLPGVQDANAARAKVAGSYLQHCHKIWIVCPIKRAVDDKIAKDLLGEEFQRRLYMDGQYANLAFVCTHSDDCEVSEILQDHEDVARKEAGRWEWLTEKSQQIAELDKQRDALEQSADDLRTELEDLQLDIEELKEEPYDPIESDEVVESSTNSLCNDGTNEELKQEPCNPIKKEQDGGPQVTLSRDGNDTNALKTKIDEVNTLRAKLDDNLLRQQSCVASIRQMQQELKPVAAKVRNEYSTQSLQLDFLNGFDELIGKAGGYEDENPVIDVDNHLPKNYKLEVYCTAANDYLKLQKIKTGSDGRAGCFTDPHDTQIPNVIQSVHETTSMFCKIFAEQRSLTTAGILQRLHNCTSENQELTICGKQNDQIYQDNMRDVKQDMQAIVKNFDDRFNYMLDLALKPALERAVKQGDAMAMPIVNSWGSPSYRTKTDHGPKNNGLKWNTYSAVIKRSGQFVSSVAGRIDLNQELCNPMERAFSLAWQTTLDHRAKEFLCQARQRYLQYTGKKAESLVFAALAAGIDSQRAGELASTFRNQFSSDINALFQAIETILVEDQRKINRSLLPWMTMRMTPSYTAANDVPKGVGKFSRQKAVLVANAEKALVNKLRGATKRLLTKVVALKGVLVSKMNELPNMMDRRIYSIYCVSKDDGDYFEAMKLPAKKSEAIACKNRLLPEILGLREANSAAMKFMTTDDGMDEDAPVVETTVVPDTTRS